MADACCLSRVVCVCVTRDQARYTKLREMAVFCPCREPHALDSSSIPSLLGEDDCFFPAASLLFCTACHAVRCPYCTIKEPVSWYCSQCLMETTKRGAVESSNRCLRNCLRCPRCKSNAVIKPRDDENYQVRCSLCDFEITFERINDKTPAVQIRDAQMKRFSSVLSQIQRGLPPYPSTRSKGLQQANAAAPSSSFTDNRVQVTQIENGEGLPSLVPLRVKYKKLCRVCGVTLADPDRHPSKVKYLVRSVALPYLPALEIHKVGESLKILVRSFSETSLEVQLASLQPQFALPASLRVPPVTGAGFPSPLFLVSRESMESKQAFMSGAESVTQGPGWAVGDVELQEGWKKLNSLTVFTSAHASGQRSGDSVGAWMKIKIPPNDA